jgi:hypothetical protein
MDKPNANSPTKLDFPVSDMFFETPSDRTSDRLYRKQFRLQISGLLADIVIKCTRK